MIFFLLVFVFLKMITLYSTAKIILFHFVKPQSHWTPEFKWIGECSGKLWFYTTWVFSMSEQQCPREGHSSHLASTLEALQKLLRDFPGSLEVRTPQSHCWGLGSISSWQLRSHKPCSATKKKKKKNLFSSTESPHWSCLSISRVQPTLEYFLEHQLWKQQAVKWDPAPAFWGAHSWWETSCSRLWQKILRQRFLKRITEVKSGQRKEIWRRGNTWAGLWRMNKSLLEEGGMIFSSQGTGRWGLRSSMFWENSKLFEVAESR